jgi:hypothetical protein
VPDDLPEWLENLVGGVWEGPETAARKAQADAISRAEQDV